MFHLENIYISYKDTPVLKNISIKIKDGEKVALIGPSGSGKTTLLKKLFEIKQKRAAFIHQDYALVPQLSVLHNVYIGRLDQYSTVYNLLNLIKLQHEEVVQIGSILESLGMGDKMSVKVAKLSSGQQQRVAIARAIFKGGDLLLGDEPVSSIDPHQAVTVLKLLMQMSRTVVVSLHSVQLALKFFDRIIGLRYGKVHFDLPCTMVNNSLLSELYQSC